MESNFPESSLLLEQNIEPEKPSTHELLTILKIINGGAVQLQQKTTNRITNDVIIEPMKTNQILKRHNFVRNRRPMADCLSNCIRRVQRVIACKNLCFWTSQYDHVTT